MISISLAEAKARLSELVDRAAAGDEVQITRRGKVVAKIGAAERKMKPVDIHLLQAAVQGQPHQPEGVATWLRAMRDDDRY